MKKTLLIILPFLLFLTKLSAQSVSPDVIGAAGDFFSNGSGQLQWTLGEVMVETYQNSNFVTQGFHQPDYGVLTSVPSANSFSSIIVYPNPAVGNVTFSFASAKGDFSIELFDLLGSRVFYDSITITAAGQLYDLSLMKFSSAVYFARIFSASEQIQHTYQIIKSK